MQNENLSTTTEDKNDEKETPLQNIRTIKTDTAEIMRKKETSLAELYLKQKSGQPTGNGNDSPGSKNKNLLIAYGAVAVIITAAIAGFIFFFGKENPLSPETVTPENQQPPKALLTSQKQTIIEAQGKESLEKKIKQAILTTYKIGGLIYLPIKKSGSETSGFANSKEFLQLLNAEPPELISRHLLPNFYLGIISLDKNYPVLILEVDKKEYESAIVGMTKWEKQLPYELSFMLENPLKSYESPSYKDKIIKNQNARTIETEEGTILIYSVFNKKYIIVTASQKSFEETIKQLILFKL